MAVGLAIGEGEGILLPPPPCMHLSAVNVA